ncbi:Cys-tRNA(Pro) deacylase [Aquipuribacter sp. SD81]|uniref:Cys-tRNA(Pro) deacylase n=1 Tax=Aquipuribacter sp. SD81 TaxID=3127703 RepID=UPI003016DEA6
MSRRAGRGGGTPATAALEAAGTEHTVHAYDHDPRTARESGYGLEAAEALGLDPRQVYKTLLVQLEPAGRPGLGVAVVPVSARLDLKAVAAALGAKRASMADPAAAERATGYVVGGISPLGQRTRLPTVVDASALDHEHVYVSGGRRGLDLGLAPGDLVALTSAVTAAVARSTAAP